MPSSGEILSKVNKWFPLNALGYVRQGIAENPSYINKKTSRKYGNKYQIGEGVFVLDQKELSKLKIPKNEQDILRDYLTLKDLGRYTIRVPNKKLIYSTRYTCPNINIYPAIKKHLNKFKPIMEARCETLKGSNSWWHLHWPRDETIWQAQKIISIQMASRPSFVPVFCSSYAPFSVNVYIPIDKTKEHLCYISALLNSKLLWYWFEQNAKHRGVNLEINGNVLSRSPIRKIDFSNNDDSIRYNKIVVLVDRMLDLNKKLAGTKTGHEKTVLQRRIDGTDGQIDQLVYELYDLTEEEIKIVEEVVG